MNQLLEQILDELKGLKHGQDFLQKEVSDLRSGQESLRSEVSDLKQGQLMLTQKTDEIHETVCRMEANQPKDIQALLITMNRKLDNIGIDFDYMKAKQSDQEFKLNRLEKLVQSS